MNKQLYFFGHFVAFMIVSNSTVLLPFSWGIGYYVVLLCTMLLLILTSCSKVSIMMICLYLVSALSIALNDIPVFFNSWTRLGTFIMLTVIVSPTTIGKSTAVFKVRLFSSFILLSVFVVIISMGMLFLGMGRSFLSGWFQGAMAHSMLMGPVAAISILFCLLQLQYKPRKNWIKYFYVVCAFGSFLCLMQSGSRAALIGGVFSFIAFFYFRHFAHLGSMLKKIIRFGVILAIAFPIWIPYADKIIQKNQGNTVSLNTDSRSAHWEQRFKEWESSPLYGIGFASVDTTSTVSNFNATTGGIETGSSWLSVLSMTGVLGAVCIVTIFTNAVIKCRKVLQRSAPVGAFLLAILVFFVFHMMAEGYIFAGGNFLNTQLWLLIGTIYIISQYPQYVSTLERQLQFGE